jgi:class 3 adenylate cyclase/CHASE2 domain-containing sensor protein
MLRRHYRIAVTAACGVLAGFLTAVGGGTLMTDGIAFDWAARAAVGWRSPDRPDPGSAVAVVQLDDRSLAAAELSAPRTFLGPQWAELIEALVAAEVKAIGFDILFPISANEFKAIAPNYDRGFLAALNQNQDRITLGRSLQIQPANPYLFAVGANFDDNSLGFVETAPDRDNVFRRYTTKLRDLDGSEAPTLVSGTLAKAGLETLPNKVLWAPRGPLEVVVPTYSMIDILRCAGQPETLRAALAGKVVFVGTGLPEEDRKHAGDHVFPVDEKLWADHKPPADEGCRLAQAGVSSPGNGVPGVYLHAMAADSILRGRGVTEMPLWVTTLVASLMAMGGAQAAFRLRPTTAGLTLLVGVLYALLADAALLARLMWVPPSFALVGSVLSVGGAFGARYLVEERRRRQVQNAFCHYLSPVLVARLADGQEQLRLGGETRDITIMFADLSGFTALSGKVGPAELMEITNHYLGFIVEAVEATGGYVDKFIGDAVMALWGAPASDPDHAYNAVIGAMAAADRIDKARREAEAQGQFGFSVKIGLCSGEATVGNVGTPKRFNYTAVGETVNIASRLEGLPGTYGCRIVIAEETARRVADRMLLCELDWVRVKGKAQPLTVFEPMVAREAATIADRAYADAYGRALARYRARDFAVAHDMWTSLTHPLDDGSASAQVMADRAESLRLTPPPTSWDGVWYVPKG